MLSLLLLLDVIVATLFVRSSPPCVFEPRAVAPRDAVLVAVPAGTVQIGDAAGPPDETPVLAYASHRFLMDRTPVTVAQFAAFVRDTGYETDAERIIR